MRDGGGDNQIYARETSKDTQRLPTRVPEKEMTRITLARSPKFDVPGTCPFVQPVTMSQRSLENSVSGTEYGISEENSDRNTTNAVAPIPHPWQLVRVLGKQACREAARLRRARTLGMTNLPQDPIPFERVTFSIIIWH